MNNQYFNANYAYPSFQTYRDNVYDREGRFVIADDGFAKGNLDRLIYKPYRNYVVKSPVVNGEKEQFLLMGIVLFYILFFASFEGFCRFLMECAP